MLHLLELLTTTLWRRLSSASLSLTTSQVGAFQLLPRRLRFLQGREGSLASLRGGPATAAAGGLASLGNAASAGPTVLLAKCKVAACSEPAATIAHGAREVPA